MTDTGSPDDCGCCKTPETEAPGEAPGQINPPGLTAIAFRAGEYSTFLERLLRGLGSGGKPAPTTRATDDPAIALLDAAASVGDVLTFYSERLANEAFLRTATERRSVLELARSIGYELKPGVAASAYLAFEMADIEPSVPQLSGAPGVPKEVMLDPGIQVMSVPAGSEPPQVFETVEAVRARPGWNALRPRRTLPQPLPTSLLDPANAKPLTLYLEGTSLNLKPGDVVLFAGKEVGGNLVFDGGAAGPVVAFARPIHAVAEDDKIKWTRVDFAPVPGGAPAAPQPPTLKKPVYEGKTDLSTLAVSDVLSGRSVLATDLVAFLNVQGWSPEVVQSHVAAPKTAPSLPDLGIFVMRARTGFFGNNAPRQETLPKPENLRGTDPYAQPWDGSNRRTIWTDSQGNTWSAATGQALVGDAYLDRVLPEVTAGTWAVFDDAEENGVRFKPYRVARATETSVADYGMSARVTGLNLLNPDPGDPPAAPAKPGGLRSRTATAYLDSDKLVLAQTPILDLVPAAKPLTLDRLDLRLAAGQAVVLSGTREDLEGVAWSEILFVAAVVHTDGLTVLTLADAAGNLGPRYSYVRDTVRLNANVALATHGETVREVLGSGSGATANQRFALKRPPLTYTSSAAAGGVASSLVVRVNGIRWAEVPSLLDAGPQDQVYVVSRDDGGVSTVTFGDGEHGARLPSGTNNVTAAYRTGIGASGNVPAGSLTVLMTRPLGVSAVSNPVAAGGSAEPETRDNARRSAPAAVLTLGRVVSLQDYEDYSRTFAGTAKAQATAIWRGEQYVVHVTVASSTGARLGGAPTLANLRAALDGIRDLGTEVRVADYDPRPFNLTAGLTVDPRYEFEAVRQAATAALLARFGFAARNLGQPITAAEIVAVLSAVPGVIAVDLDVLEYSVEDPENGSAVTQPRQVLVARRARWSDTLRAFLPAQLLSVDGLQINLYEKS